MDRLRVEVKWLAQSAAYIAKGLLEHPNTNTAFKPLNDDTVYRTPHGPARPVDLGWNIFESQLYDNLCELGMRLEALIRAGLKSVGSGEILTPGYAQMLRDASVLKKLIIEIIEYEFGSAEVLSDTTREPLIDAATNFAFSAAACE